MYKNGIAAFQLFQKEIRVYKNRTIMQLMQLSNQIKMQANGCAKILDHQSN